MNRFAGYGRLVLLILILALAVRYCTIEKRGGEVEAQVEETETEEVEAVEEVAVVYEEREAEAVRTAGAIDAYLARIGSPMVGLGRVYVAEAERVGIDPTLPAAISVVESSGGKACFASYNAWGLMAYKQGFRSWEDGIRTVCEFLHRHYGAVTEAWQCRGYCVPDRPWMDRVSAVQREMRRLAR